MGGQVGKGGVRTRSSVSGRSSRESIEGSSREGK